MIRQSGACNKKNIHTSMVKSERSVASVAKRERNDVIMFAPFFRVLYLVIDCSVEGVRLQGVACGYEKARTMV